MRKVIEDVYYGNICPGDQVAGKDSRYAKAQETTVSAEDIHREGGTEECRRVSIGFTSE